MAARRRSPRPPELDDPAWLRERYRVAGDDTIARELGVHRSTIRGARARHGIASRPRGRRSTKPSTAKRSTEPVSALARVAVRIVDESGSDGPAPTFDLLAQRVRCVHGARVEGDRLGLEEALVGLAVAAALVLDGLDRLAENGCTRLTQTRAGGASRR